MTDTALRTAGKPAAVSMASLPRHWEVTLSRLENATPKVGDPAAMKSAVPGTQRCGTVISLIGTTGALVDITPGMIYFHNVRNVITYATGDEATFRALSEGDPIYYDRSSTMPENVFLSTSPKDKDGADNPLFGFAVLNAGEVSTDFTKGDTTGHSVGCAVVQA